MTRQLELIDTLVVDGKDEFTFDDAIEALDRSPTATANTLRRLQDNGLVDRSGRGHYAIHPPESVRSWAAGHRPTQLADSLLRQMSA